MPIDYRKYPSAWKRISRLIRKRAGDRCEWCGVQNHKAHPATGSLVVLTAAHLGEPFAVGGNKHDKFDIRAENLAALCQRCHLRYDAKDHANNRRKNREQLRQIQEPLLL